MRIEARAKINWTLDITGRRDDGYHLMDMLMQSVTLCDVVTLSPAEDITLICGGTPLLPADERHLALRAARALAAHTGCTKGAAIHVDKRIPVGAGMGGGSADAAAVLAGLNLLWDTGLTQEELEVLGLTLGADVPFCLRGGLTRTTGVGEVMLDLPCGRCWPLVVIQPCEGLSTKEIFEAYHADESVQRPDNATAAIALATGDADALAGAMANVMQPVSTLRRPAIGDAITALLDMGAFAAQMTGSGSAVIGAFTDGKTADAACEALRDRWERTWRCDACMKGMVIHHED